MLKLCRCVGIGRRGGLKILCQQWHAGSTPATGTRKRRLHPQSSFSMKFFPCGTSEILLRIFNTLHDLWHIKERAALSAYKIAFKTAHWLFVLGCSITLSNRNHYHFRHCREYDSINHASVFAGYCDVPVFDCHGN